MNFELQQIKKKYGEKMAHLCRTLFPTILEKEGKLLELLMTNFEPNKFLYDDIIDNDLTSEFKDYIYGLIDVENDFRIKSDKSPKELLALAGYDLYECHSEEEIQAFRKYYEEDEMLCTFTQGNRLNTDYVFFAVKKNVDNIKRENFTKPKREDEYGTSVISIQFSRGKTNTLSIKNRYNHRVNNPDATFENNLENIIGGLTDSFEKEYGLNINQNDIKFNIPGYIRAKDRKYYKYNYEINNIYYCPNNLIIDNNQVIRKYQEPEKYILIDYFILDLTTKEIKLYDINYKDSLVETISPIKRITISKEDNKNKNLLFVCKDNTEFEITIDQKNRMQKFKNNNIIEIPSNYLINSNNLEYIELKNVEVIRDGFLKRNEKLKEINAPRIKKIYDDFLCFNKNLKNFIGENIEMIGKNFLRHNEKIENIELPIVENIDKNFLCESSLKKIDFPKLKSVGENFLSNNNKLEEASLPNLVSVEENFLNESRIKEIDFPMLLKTKKNFMNENDTLEIISANRLSEVDDYFLSNAKDLKEVYFPNLTKVGNNCLSVNRIKKITLPKLIEAGHYFMQKSDSLEIFNAPNVKRIGHHFLEDSDKMKRIELESLIETGNSFMRFNESINEILLPNLKSTLYGFIQYADNINYIDIHNLRMIGEDSLNGFKLTDEDVPNLINVIGYNNNNISMNYDNRFYPIIKKNRDRQEMLRDQEKNENNSIKYNI